MGGPWLTEVTVGFIMDSDKWETKLAGWSSWEIVLAFIKDQNVLLMGSTCTSWQELVQILWQFEPCLIIKYSLF